MSGSQITVNKAWKFTMLYPASGIVVVQNVRITRDIAGYLRAWGRNFLCLSQISHYISIVKSGINAGNCNPWPIFVRCPKKGATSRYLNDVFLQSSTHSYRGFWKHLTSP